MSFALSSTHAWCSFVAGAPRRAPASIASRRNRKRNAFPNLLKVGDDRVVEQKGGVRGATHKFVNGAGRRVDIGQDVAKQEHSRRVIDRDGARTGRAEASPRPNRPAALRLPLVPLRCGAAPDRAAR